MLLDSHLNFDSHAKSVVAACNYHTHDLRHICKVLSEDFAKTIACSIISARMDYCNALLCGAPATTIDKLQWAQNTLARVVTHSARQTPSRPLLQSLHWLPVWEHIDYKVALSPTRCRRRRYNRIWICCCTDTSAHVACGRPMHRDLSSQEHVLNSLAALFLLRTHLFGMASPKTFNSVKLSQHSKNI